MIEIGKISTVNTSSGSVKVILSDGLISGDLYLVSMNEVYYPQIDDLVVCAFTPNREVGFCLGKYYTKSIESPVKDANVFYKDLFSEGYIKYNKIDKTLTIKAENILIEGDLKVTGNLEVKGDIKSDGVIINNSISTNNHSH